MSVRCAGTHDKIVNTYAVFLLVIIVISVVAGIGDSMVRNWDHSMHMASIERSTPIDPSGWRAYGSGYYRIAAIARYLLDPIYTTLNRFGVETLGLQASGVLVNLLLYTSFIFLALKALEIRCLSLTLVILLWLSGPLFYWSFRVYPDVALMGILGMVLVLIIRHISEESQMRFLVIAGILMGLALHTKQPAIFLLPGYCLVLVAGARSIRDPILFTSVVAVAFLVIGYPDEYQLVHYLINTIQGDNRMMQVNAAEFNLPWVIQFFRDALCVSIIPVVPLIFARSNLIESSRIIKERYWLILIALFFAQAIIAIFFLSKPLTVVTEHYMLITLPNWAMAFLFIRTPFWASKAGIHLSILVSIVTLYIHDWRYPMAFVKAKSNEVSCISEWRTAEEVIDDDDLRTPYIPYGIRKGRFFYQPARLLDEISKRGTVKVLTGLWLNRFAREDRIALQIEKSVARHGSLSQEEIQGSFDLLIAMESIAISEPVSVGSYRLSVIAEDADCGMKVIEIKRATGW